MSVNKAILVGHVGQDPEIRTMQDGRPVATFSLATSERWRDKATGERQERTEWHKVVVFNEYLIPVIKQYVKKGSKLFLQGAIKSRKFNDKQGIERWVTEIVLGAFQSELALLDRAERAPPPEEDAYGSDSSRSSTRDQMDDEVPF